MKLYEQAIDLVESLFENCSNELRQQIYSKPEDIRIAMPKEFLELIEAGQRQLFKYTAHEHGKIKHFRGIEIVPNYQMSLVIYHIECAKIVNGTMKFEIQLAAAPPRNAVFVYHDVSS